MSEAALAGRRALVTGGSRGIGAEIVRRLAADGAAVAFTYSSSKTQADAVVAEVAATGATVHTFQADATDPAQIEVAVERAAAELGGLDIVVNNAATAHIAQVDEFTSEQYDRMIATNIGGPFWTVHSALAHLGAGARIINIGSANADRNPTPATAVYALTKGAVSSFTRGLARELGPRGITVNNVQPGPINTEMNPDEGDFADTIRQITALGRFGRTSEVAAAVTFLAGLESAYVTGATLNVDGGFTV